MDPFSSVLQDAEKQLGSAQLLLRQYRAQPSTDRLLDLQNTIQDISEVIHELSGSIAVAQTRPQEFGLGPAEIERRIECVAHINSQVTDIQEALAGIRSDTHASQVSENPFANPALESRASSQAPVSSEDRQLLFQSTIEDQDAILDEVERTVSSLREQANVMTMELDDQAELIDDFEAHVDRSNDRLRRGLRRVDWVLRNNRDTLSSCFIGLLIVVLILLLVLVVVT